MALADDTQNVARAQATPASGHFVGRLSQELRPRENRESGTRPRLCGPSLL
jgi:hypothetical protein